MSAARDIRLVLADVDGTLLTHDKVLTSAAKAVVQDLARADIAFAITSGRPPRGMSMLIGPLGLRTAIAGFNGGVLVDPGMTVIESHTLDPAIAKHTFDLLSDLKMDVWIYTVDQWLVRDITAPHVAREAWTVKFQPGIVPSFSDAHLARAVKIVGISDDLDLVSAGEQQGREILGVNASVARSQPYYLDVTHPQANKAAVVRTMARLMDISPDQIATMGDMPNDVVMFQQSGFSIAMGNAGGDVKAAASVVTDSNEDEGFAKAVRKFILRDTRKGSGDAA